MLLLPDGNNSGGESSILEQRQGSFSTNSKGYKAMAYNVLRETQMVKNSSEFQGRLNEICNQEYPTDR